MARRFEPVAFVSREGISRSGCPAWRSRHPGAVRDRVCKLVQRHGLGNVELLVAGPVIGKTRRIPAEKLEAAEGDLVAVRRSMAIAAGVSSEKGDPPADIPDPGDVPIIAAAPAREAEPLVTDDKDFLALGHSDPLLRPSDRSLLRVNGSRP